LNPGGGGRQMVAIKTHQDAEIVKEKKTRLPISQSNPPGFFEKGQEWH
jgi:hypothetical protein